MRLLFWLLLLLLLLLSAGCSPAEIRETLCNAFSGTAVLPDITALQQSTLLLHQHPGSLAAPGWRPSSGSGSSSLGGNPLPAAPAPRKRPWLPYGFKVTARGAAEPGMGLEWGSKKPRSARTGRQQQQQQGRSATSGARAGMAALLAAGVPLRGKSTRKPHAAAPQQQQQQQPGALLPRLGQWHPAAAAAAGGGFMGVRTSSGSAVGMLPGMTALQPRQFPQLPHGLMQQLPLSMSVPAAAPVLGIVAGGGRMQFDGTSWHAPGAVPAQPLQLLPALPQPPAAPAALAQEQPAQMSGESAMLAKMMTDLQNLSKHCKAVAQGLQQFQYELTQDAAALESAAVAGPNTQQEVSRTVGAVEACQAQERELQQLLTETMQLLQPALTSEERTRLQANSVRLAPSLEALAGTLSDVCKAVLRAVVAQDAAACAAAALATGQGGNVVAAAAAGALAAVNRSDLSSMHQAVGPSLDKIPAGSARALRMTRLSKGIKSTQECMAAARKVLGGQA